jgi:hypothetical protein
LDSVGSSLGLPQNFLHEFIAFFGDTLIEKAGARQWAEYALAHRSSEEIEKQLNELLKEYAIELASKPPTFWVSDCLKQTHQVQDFAQSQVLTGAINLIRRYRPKIAQYFRSNAVSLPVGTASLSERLQELGQQLSLTERLGLFTKSSSNTKNPDLQTDDDIKDDGEEGELVANLGPVRDLLVSSDAFRRLALDLRRTLYHDEGVEMEKIRCALLEGKQHPLHNAKFNVNWALSEFMHTQYGRELPSIGSVVVLTGSALYAQATTCAEYIKSTWPKTGHILIELLDTALKVPNTAPIHINKDCEGLPLIVNIRSGPTGDLIFYARGSDELLMVELVQQIAFIGSALSTSPFGDELAYATPSVRRTSYPSMFDISFEHKRLHATETACWLPLFRGAVIASGFPIPNRADEMGLEIPLELLAGIAGVRHAVEYEGGIVMKGFSHMFIPVRKLDDRVQWHAISSQDPETRLSYQDALARCKARALSKEVSLEHIQSCRAIVGWCSVATSRLGSDLANYENIDYSGAKDVDSAIRCAGGSLGFQQFGMAALDFKFGAKDGKCHFQRSGPYQRIVSAAEKTPIVLYDTGEQRAWLVPASSVMLHMAQHRHTLEPFEMNEKRVRLNTNVPLDSSAKKVLLNNESLRLSDTEEYTFKDVILNIWSLLEFLIDQNVTRDRNASGACLKGTLHDSLTGFEFKAVVEERSPFRQKQMHLGKTNGGWPQLVRDIDALVLLADGFEDIILPADQGNPRLCRSWQRVPKGQDHLATSTKTLKELYDVAGCRLSRKYLTSTQLQWHQGDSILFDACKGFAKTCQCSRLQQIFPKSAVGAIIPPKIILDQGAVIFGQTGSMLQDLRSKLHTQTPKSSSIYSQPNIPLTPIVIKHDPEDPSFSDGDIWGQSGSDATAESTPGSLSTCTTLSTQDAPSEINELSMNMYLSTGSRKRLHLPESCSGLSNEDDKEQKESPDFACKRPKSSHVDGIPLPPLSTSPKYNDDEKDALGRRYSRSDSLLPGSNWTIFPTDKRYDYALPSTTAAETQDYVEDGENTGSLPLTVRLVDEKPLRTLRRRDGFH